MLGGQRIKNQGGIAVMELSSKESHSSSCTCTSICSTCTSILMISMCYGMS